MMRRTPCDCGRMKCPKAKACMRCTRSGQQVERWLRDDNVWFELREKKRLELVGDPIPHVWDRGDEAEDAISPWD